ncbi:MAG: hypothetical protein AAF385_13100 [Pseudomonadota bacterium]
MITRYRTLPVMGLAMFYLVLIAASGHARELMITRSDNLHFARDENSGDIYFDLYQNLWRLQSGQTVAEKIAGVDRQVLKPTIQTQGNLIAFESRCDATPCVVLYNLESREEEVVFADSSQTHDPSFSADGTRLAVAATIEGNTDIWEIELNSRTRIRRSFSPDREYSPAYAPHNNELVWIRTDNLNFSIERAQPQPFPRTVYRSQSKLSGISFRSDGSVLTVFQQEHDASKLKVLLPDLPGVAKDLLLVPGTERQGLVWLDRQRALLLVDGAIRIYEFGARPNEQVPFTAWVSISNHASSKSQPHKQHASKDPHTGRYVLRMDGAFDGTSDAFSGPTDILIDGEFIAQIGPVRNWGPDLQVLDYSGAKALPGMIALLDGNLSFQQVAASMLAAGITSVACLSENCLTDLPEETSGPAPAIHSSQHIVDVRGLSTGTQLREVISSARRERLAVLSERAYPDLAWGANLYAMRLPWLHSTSENDEYGQLLAASAARILMIFDSFALHSAAAGMLWPQYSQGNAVAVALDLAGLDPATTVHDIYAVLRRQGLSGASAWRSLSLDVALAIGAGGHSGTLDKGRFADILIINGDPFADPASSSGILAIIQRGRFYTRAGIENLHVE